MVSLLLYFKNMKLIDQFKIIFLLVTCLKCLLIPLYHSTDFEVHRNWMSIVHSLPLSKWYYSHISPWTLDYPPFFAWFEMILSFFAKYFDKNMLILNNLNYDSFYTILYQRLTVIISDILLYKSILSFVNLLKYKKNKLIIYLLLLLNPGLLIVDHIHFQYNGFLFSILLYSISSLYQDHYIQASLYFSILLNFKHIYIYMAPVYFIYLLYRYCINVKSFKNLIFIASTVLFIFFISFGPFYQDIEQVFTRLFPFDNRGLCHAYWAPNFWAIYNIIDKIIVKYGHFIGFNINNINNIAFMTGGLVEDVKHMILPEITPLTTFIITFITMLPALIMLSSKAIYSNFIRVLVLCTFSSYLFGWHVHEKAILMIIIPLTCYCFDNKYIAQIFYRLVLAGIFSLFPLLYTKPYESLVKVLILIIYLCLIHYLYHLKSYKLNISWYEQLYYYGFIALYISTEFNEYFLPKKMTFLPLLMISIYCAIGVIWSYISLWYEFIIHYKKINKKKYI